MTLVKKMRKIHDSVRRMLKEKKIKRTNIDRIRKEKIEMDDKSRDLRLL